MPLNVSARISSFPVLRSVRVTRGIPPVAMPLRSAVGDAAPSAATSRPCGSITMPVGDVALLAKDRELAVLAEAHDALHQDVGEVDVALGVDRRPLQHRHRRRDLELLHRGGHDCE